MEPKELLAAMTLEEKASLCSGKDFWHLKAVERLGVPSIMVTDGPHGLRKQAGGADHLGINKSVAATCFPTAAATACSWDPARMREMGEALAEECLQEDVSVILGPGANIKRSPLCGRNFEYISEDPCLTGEIAAGLIGGVQSKGIGTSLKHFAMNNQETRRMTSESVADRRAQREIYLAGFERAVKKAQPYTVMCSYNLVEGEYLSDNRRLLTDILKEEWGHTGLVMSDWGATNDRVRAVHAGMELEMPASGGKNDEAIVSAVQQGALSMEDLDKAVLRILELIQKAVAARKPGYRYDVEAHRSLARTISRESSVLLKNDGGFLPLSKSAKIALVGDLAETPRYQGAGSSLIQPHQVVSALEAFEEKGVTFTFARGYDAKSDAADPALAEEAMRAAAEADAVVVFAGLPERYESEGFDRTDLGIPENQTALIHALAGENPNIVVVLQNGAPVTMPFLGDVKAVLESYLGGENGAAASADLLFGDANPCGKLAETFPLCLEDTPCYRYFPGGQKTTEYRESIYVGYRYYDAAEKDVLFPFGFGLSYTTFAYGDLRVEQAGEAEFDVSFTLQNTGGVSGSEIAQVYVQNNESAIFKAKKSSAPLRRSVSNPERRRRCVCGSTGVRSHIGTLSRKNWHVEAGRYGVQIGASSRDIRLTAAVQLAGEPGTAVPDYRAGAPVYYSLPKGSLEVDAASFEALLGRALPPGERSKDAPYDQNTTLGEIGDTWIGKKLFELVSSNMRAAFGGGASGGEAMLRMADAMAREMPLRLFGMLGGDKLPKYFVEGVLAMLQKKPLKGIRYLMKK